MIFLFSSWPFKLGTIPPGYDHFGLQPAKLHVMNTVGRLHDHYGHHIQLNHASMTRNHFDKSSFNATLQTRIIS